MSKNLFTHQLRRRLRSRKKLFVDSKHHYATHSWNDESPYGWCVVPSRETLQHTATHLQHCVPHCNTPLARDTAILIFDCNRNLLPLREGLCSSNPCRFKFSVFLSFCQNRTHDLVIISPALWSTELALHRLGYTCNTLQHTAICREPHTAIMMNREQTEEVTGPYWACWS